MTDREIALSAIAAGDLFHAAAPNGASLICLALSTSATQIVARSITSQRVYMFDRKTGVALHEGKTPCTIDSPVAPPAEVANILRELDRSYAEQTRPDERLSDREKRALAFAAQYATEEPIEYASLTKEQKIELILANFQIPGERD